MLRNLYWGSVGKTFASVVGGNAIYFSIQEFLPYPLRHRPFHLDWGILTDFWICLFFWGVLDLFGKFRPRSRSD
ncbi:MAG: hypothetical protein DMG06_02695 [Acidobacteria bacterium]|nr:MAG: hypothetical protein DMG06_02695 [Acidobacteriota bacterium]